MTAAVAAVIEDAIDHGMRAVQADPEGLVIPIGRGKFAHLIRVLTAAIDYLWGWRDYLRGGKEYAYPRFGPCVVDPSYLEAA